MHCLHRPLLTERRSNFSYIWCSGCELLLSKILVVRKLVTGYTLVPRTHMSWVSFRF
jgi:hypothetical protein